MLKDDPWPFFALKIITPTLELRYATDDLLMELTAVADDVIQPGTLPLDGDASFYDRSVAGRRRWLAVQWAARGRTSPGWWVLVFAVIVDGHPVGTQEISATDFPTLRTAGTFSWLTRSQQGHGVGKEMRAAILHFAFAGLGAARMTSEAFIDNAASNGVSQALGYKRDGMLWALRKGEPAPMNRYVMSREQWMMSRRDDIAITGLDACTPLLGIEQTATQPPSAPQ